MFQSVSRSGSFGSAHSSEIQHVRSAADVRGAADLKQANNNYNKPPNTEHPSKLLSAAEHLSYVETLRKLEKVYNVIEEYAEKMNMVVSQRAHWIEDKHCIVSVQLQRKGRAASTPPVITTSALMLTQCLTLVDW